MFNEIRRVFSRATPAQIVEAILGLICLIVLFPLFLIITP